MVTKRDGKKDSSETECVINCCVINSPPEWFRTTDSLSTSGNKEVKDSGRVQRGNSAALVGLSRGVQLENEQVWKVHGDFI